MNEAVSLTTKPYYLQSDMNEGINTQYDIFAT
jgi:hypothetical protein